MKANFQNGDIIQKRSKKMTPYKEYAIKLDKAFKRARANYLEAFAELTEVKEAYDKASTSDRPEFFFR